MLILLIQCNSDFLCKLIPEIMSQKKLRHTLAHNLSKKNVMLLTNGQLVKEYSRESNKKD